MLLADILERTSQTPWVDIVPLASTCALDIICQTAMGVKIDAQAGGHTEFSQALHELEEGAFYRILRPWLYVDWIYFRLPPGRQLTRNLEIIHGFTKKGNDTTSMTVSFSLYLLGLNDSVQKKVHEELDNIFEDDITREITKYDLAEMKYLECAIKETMRLYPTIPFFTREVNEDIEILNYRIKSGSMCFIFPYMLHRDPEYFPDPEKFMPERFFPENST